MSAAEISLLVRTGALARDRASFTPDQEEIKAVHAPAEHSLIYQAIESARVNPIGLI
jgi:hypothetical protein